MTDATQPRLVMGTKLLAAVLAVAMFALLAFAPFASAASDPVGSGSTKMVVKKGFKKKLNKKNIKLQKWGGGKLNGRQVSLRVTGGAYDPLTGQGRVENAEKAGFKLKYRKRNVPIYDVEVNTVKKWVRANVAGKKMKFGLLAKQFPSTRDGFGTAYAWGKVKLTNNAAKRISNKLGMKNAFKGGNVISNVSGTAQPSEATLEATGTATLQTELPTIEKFLSVGVEFVPVAPSTEEFNPLPLFTFPLSGGAISPAGDAGTVMTAGGVIIKGPEVEPDPEKAPGLKTRFLMELTEIWVDLTARTATANVSITSENPIFSEAVPGALGRSSIGNVDLTNATIVSDPTARTVSISNAKATVQAVTAEVLNEIFAGKAPLFVEGDSLGVFAFVATTQ